MVYGDKKAVKIVSKYLVEIMLLAAASDGQIDPEETQFFETYRQLYPPIRDITQAEFEGIKLKLFNKTSAGMKPHHMVEEIGENLSEPQKNKAYALALEICASNFEILPLETDFLKLIEKSWKIKRNIMTALYTSIELRYQK